MAVAPSAPELKAEVQSFWDADPCGTRYLETPEDVENHARLRYGIFRGKSLRQSSFDHLESPGTKSYTKREIRSMMSGFEEIELEQVLSPGDLLLNRPSLRFRGAIYRIVWALYPRWVVRSVCRELGLFLLVSARKPQGARAATETDATSS